MSKSASRSLALSVEITSWVPRARLRTSSNSKCSDLISARASSAAAWFASKACMRVRKRSRARAPIW